MEAPKCKLCGKRHWPRQGCSPEILHVKPLDSPLAKLAEPDAPLPSWVAETTAKFDRQAYQRNYMREYMRKQQSC